MGWRFRKSVRLLPSIRVNFSRSGVSTSVGVRGAHVTIGPRGTRETVGIPGTGISYTTTQGTRQETDREAQPVEVAEPLPKGRVWRRWLWTLVLVSMIALTVYLALRATTPRL